MTSPAPKAQREVQQIPLQMVGGNAFGRYPKISQAQTWNMIVSDNALVPYAGYKNKISIATSAIGRGLYASSRGNLMVAVWGGGVYRINANLAPPSATVGNLTSSTTNLFFSENNNAEIAITDNHHIYIYNWKTNVFTKSTTGTPGAGEFQIPATLKNPGYISFQNGRFLVVDTATNAWYLSGANDGQTWPSTDNSIGSLQSKPDLCQAAVPAPGGGNNMLLFGHNVVEQWQDAGLAIFPYQRSSTFNIDYGALNAASIATLDRFIVWLAGNEQSGATLMLYDGRSATSVSTDGIDFKLANLSNPTNCLGFLFRQDGHVIYQFTFPDDNLSYAYDLNTKKFFTVSDEHNNYHIAHNVVFFNNVYYFVSLKGGNLYAFGTQFTNLEYSTTDIQQMPRLRVCPPLRLPSQQNFIVKLLGFTIENGQKNNITTVSNTQSAGFDITTEDSFIITTESGVFITTEYNAAETTSYTIASEAVDLSISRDGGESFGNSYRQDMNRTGKRRSLFTYERLGQANDFTPQLKFIGFGRFVAFDGVVEIYQ